LDIIHPGFIEALLSLDAEMDIMALA
jgi:hypothetical protein